MRSRSRRHFPIWFALWLFGSVPAWARVVDLGAVRLSGPQSASTEFVQDNRGSRFAFGRSEIESPWQDLGVNSFSDVVNMTNLTGMAGNRHSLPGKMSRITTQSKPGLGLVLICVLGLIAFQLRRTHRLLAHHPLA